MNIGSVDLRLLRLFDALIVQRSVSRAAFQVGMTQPAASNALKRLRGLAGDELFVRSGDGMKPTPLALRMGPQIGEALRKLEAALRLDTFDPLKATNVFRLAVSDHAAIVFLPQLLEHVQRVAPEVVLRVEPKSNSEIEGKLDRGEVDLAIGVIPPLAKRFKRINLFEDSYVLLMRTGHPLASRNLKMSDVADAGHLAVRPAYSSESGIDFLFRRAGLERRIQLSTTQFLAIPGILRSSNLLASMFRRMTSQIDRSGIIVRNVPLENKTVRVTALWPRDFDGDAAHSWLRGQLKVVADGLGPIASKS